MPPSDSAQPLPSPTPPPRGLSEDWTAVCLGLLILAVGFLASTRSRPGNLAWDVSEAGAKSVKWDSPLKTWIGKTGGWSTSPIDALRDKPKAVAGEETPAKGKINLSKFAGVWLATLLIGGLAIALRGKLSFGFLPAFSVLFLLASLSYVLAGQTLIAKYNLEYALWALLVGLIISNTIGTPVWLRPAVNGELYIKIGLVLLGAGVLLGRLLALGVPGIFVSWVVTPIVLISTYIFGQRVLKMQSKSLNMVISADMSVCGVSAAIATAAACRAKKEELSLAIGLSLSFTVIMMVVMPMAANFLQLDPVVAGAWIGGTIDATGAVAAAGELLGPEGSERARLGSETAVTIKMIQNILIGVIAFGVAIYWTKWVETRATDQPAIKVGVSEIWKRFPKFVLGFLAASIICSILFASSTYGELWVNSMIEGVAKPLQGWLFCLAFVCIGLDTNFRQLFPYFRSGKPAVLYVCGQTLNVLLTLLMAYLMFGVLFKNSVQ